MSSVSSGLDCFFLLLRFFLSFCLSLFFFARVRARAARSRLDPGAPRVLLRPSRLIFICVAWRTSAASNRAWLILLLDAAASDIARSWLFILRRFFPFRLALVPPRGPLLSRVAADASDDTDAIDERGFLVVARPWSSSPRPPELVGRTWNRP